MGLDSQGIWQHTEGETASLASTMLNRVPASVSTEFAALRAAWTVYTPTLTGVSIGNGTLRGGAKLVGKTATLRLSLLAGSTTTFAGVAGTLIGFGLPPGMISAAYWQTLSGIINDASTGFDYVVSGRIPPSGAGLVVSLNGALPASWHDSRPMAWTTGDLCALTGTVEVA